MRKFLGFVVAIAVAAAVVVLSRLAEPYAGFDRPVFVDVPRGASSRAIAASLAGAGVVRNTWHFLAARALRPRLRLQAGEYRFSTPASPFTVLDRLARGDVVYHEIQIPEGYNIFEIAAVVERTGIIGGDAFLAAARDSSLIRDIAPEAPSLEGYLFPDTYRITRQTTAEDLCRLLTGRFRTAWGELRTSAPVHRTVTLASLVEEETAVDDERSTVASVYVNRLSRGMKLDCDPTTVYAALLEGRWRGAIFKSDLERNHPYNTYLRAGLPPGPIANPGMAALRAALAPAPTGFLYFVALPDGSGRHLFSSSIAVHTSAAGRYRRAQKR
ncbi:MAG: endolytic transglycosylase MltG, partial [Bryobacteraceae bacterium]